MRNWSTRWWPPSPGWPRSCSGPSGGRGGLAEIDGAPVGFALFFHNFSTFLGRPGLFLEDLYVQPHARGAGVGRALLRHLAGVAVERGCGRMDWNVLDWNEPAIGFYKKLGADVLPDWRTCRVTGDALRALAASETLAGRVGRRGARSAASASDCRSAYRVSRHGGIAPSRL